MSLATCVRFCGPHSFAELNALEQRVTCIDPDVYFLSTSPITSYKDDMEFRTEVEGLIQFSTATLRAWLRVLFFFRLSNPVPKANAP